MTDLPSLIERVESGDGPDRELDVFVFGTIADKDAPWSADDITYVISRGDLAVNVPLYTTSLDAVTGLIERVLPGWIVESGGCHSDFLSQADKPFSASVMGPVTWVRAEYGEEPSFESFVGRANSEPRARLSALLHAVNERKNDE